MKPIFKNETGKIWNDNIETYCHYLIAKNSITTTQMLVDIRNSLKTIESRFPLNIK